MPSVGFEPAIPAIERPPNHYSGILFATAGSCNIRLLTDFPTKIMYAFRLSPMRSTGLAHFILLKLHVLITSAGGTNHERLRYVNLRASCCFLCKSGPSFQLSHSRSVLYNQQNVCKNLQSNTISFFFFFFEKLRKLCLTENLYIHSVDYLGPVFSSGPHSWITCNFFPALIWRTKFHILTRQRKKLYFGLFCAASGFRRDVNKILAVLECYAV